MFRLCVSRWCCVSPMRALIPRCNHGIVVITITWVSPWSSRSLCSTPCFTCLLSFFPLAPLLAQKCYCILHLKKFIKTKEFYVFRKRFLKMLWIKKHNFFKNMHEFKKYSWISNNVPKFKNVHRLLKISMNFQNIHDFENMFVDCKKCS